MPLLEGQSWGGYFLRSTMNIRTSVTYEWRGYKFSPPPKSSKKKKLKIPFQLEYHQKLLQNRRHLFYVTDKKLQKTWFEKWLLWNIININYKLGFPNLSPEFLSTLTIFIQTLFECTNGDHQIFSSQYRIVSSLWWFGHYECSTPWAATCRCWVWKTGCWYYTHPLVPRISTL